MTINQGADLAIKGMKELSTFFEVFMVAGPVSSKAPDPNANTGVSAIAALGAGTINSIGAGAKGVISVLGSGLSGGRTKEVDDEVLDRHSPISFSYKSKVKRNNNSPFWGESFECIVQDAVNQSIQIVIRDESTLVGTNYVGEIVIPAIDILKPQVRYDTLPYVCMYLKRL